MGVGERRVSLVIAVTPGLAAYVPPPLRWIHPTCEAVIGCLPGMLGPSQERGAMVTTTVSGELTLHNWHGPKGQRQTRRMGGGKDTE